jgi:hypothetical protein
MLALNGQKIKGSELKLSATLSLAGEDLSGSSSMSAQAETGDKPQALAVNMEIKYDNAKDLTDLLNLAKAKTDKGERVTYDVINDTAAAMAIRQVRFQGDISVREDASYELWKISFKLVEQRSVAEITESRQEANKVTDQTSTGTTVSDDVAPTVEELSSFEKVMKWTDSQIAGTSGEVQ